MIDVSVIVPVYNGASYIETCCRRILDQTLRNLELIVIDDGSADETWQLLQTFRQQDPRIRIFRQENRGAAAARNAGLLRARGRFIGFVDADDEIESDMYEMLLRNADEHRLDLISMEPEGSPGELRLLQKKDCIRAFLKGTICMSACNKLFRSSVLPEKPFPEGRRIYEDFYAVFCMMLRAERAAVINSCKYHYIHRQGSSSRPENFSEKFFDAVELTDLVCEEARMRYPDLADEIESRRVQTCLRISKIYYRRNSPAVYRDRIDALKDTLLQLDRRKLPIYLKKTERIRYYLYLYCKPLFLLLIHTIDRK